MKNRKHSNSEVIFVLMLAIESFKLRSLHTLPDKLAEWICTWFSSNTDLMQAIYDGYQCVFTTYLKITVRPRIMQYKLLWIIEWCAQRYVLWFSLKTVDEITLPRAFIKKKITTSPLTMTAPDILKTMVKMWFENVAVNTNNKKRHERFIGKKLNKMASC